MPTRRRRPPSTRPTPRRSTAALAAKGWRLTHILTTHHHGDHTDGNLALKAETGCTIIGPRGEAAKVPGIDKEVGEGDTFKFGAHEVRVLDTPGHTAGHITYWHSLRTAWPSSATRCSPSAAAASSRATRR